MRQKTIRYYRRSFDKRVNYTGKHYNFVLTDICIVVSGTSNDNPRCRNIFPQKASCQMQIKSGKHHAGELLKAKDKLGFKNCEISGL